jgi:cupin fold WbuC family metalloprotein
MLIPIHRHQKDLVQRMVNILQPGTYIQPHLHPRNCATETILVMEGELGFITFDQSGGVKTTHRIPNGGLVDIEECVWHGVLALEPNTIILETKRGPHDNSDKEFAGWAPCETDPEAVPYREGLEALFS